MTDHIACNILDLRNYDACNICDRLFKIPIFSKESICNKCSKKKLICQNNIFNDMNKLVNN